MTKNEYLARLESCLGQLPESERQHRLSYYQELFDDMREDGIGEREAAHILGDPEQAAMEILKDTPLATLVRTRVKPKRGWSAASVVLTVILCPIWIPLAAAAFAVMLCVYLVLWLVAALLFVAVAAIFLAGLAAILLGAVNLMVTPAPGLMLMGLGIAAAGIAFLACLGAVAVAKSTVKVTVIIARGIRSMFIRKER